MFLDLNSSEGERFEFFTSKLNTLTGEIEYDEPVRDPKTKEAAWVELRSPQPFWEERSQKQKKKVEHVLNPKTRQMERVPYVPELSVDAQRKESEEMWQYCIINFGGFADKKTEKPIACNSKTKFAMSRLAVFQRFAFKCFELMEDSKIGAKQAEEKN